MQLLGISAAMSTGQTEGAPSPKLVRAAHEFEGQMMKELLKPMTEGDALTGTEDDPDAGEGSGGALGEFASESLGQSLSYHGGLGIARQIIQELSHTGNQPEKGKVTGNLHQNHELRASQ